MAGTAFEPAMSAAPIRWLRQRIYETAHEAPVQKQIPILSNPEGW